MKKKFKKVPVFLIVTVALVLTIGVSIFASDLLYDFSNDGKVDNSDVIAVMQSITGQNVLSADQQDLADFDGNETLDVLDVIALKRYIFDFQTINDGWTVGIY